jgi:hypothetical protein
MRSDAALYALPPRRKRGQRGRPRKKGHKLPRLSQMASDRRRPWRRVKVTMRGKKRSCQVKELVALWYSVAGTRRVKVFLVRYQDKDRHGKPRTHEGYFYTTDLGLSARQAIEAYDQRWGIEVMIQDAKHMGVGDTPVRAKRSVERMIPFGLLAMATTIHWYLSSGKGLDGVRKRPWWSHDRAPSFADMRAALRQAIIADLISEGSTPKPKSQETLRDLCSALADVA